MADEEFYDDELFEAVEGDEAKASQESPAAEDKKQEKENFPQSLMSAASKSSSSPPLTEFSPPPASEPSEAPAPPPNPSPSLDPAFLANPRNSAEYQLAWELELWRREQQENFLAQLKASETAKLNQLVGEFKRQELLREQNWTVRIKSVSALEKKLQSGLFDVQQHEKQLRIREKELDARNSHVNTEIGRKFEEAELAVKRMKESLVHTQAMAKRVQGDLENQISQLKSEKNQAELKYRESEAAFSAYKGKISRSTIGELRLALAEKEISVQASEQKCRLLEEEKVTLNARLSRCLEEISTLNEKLEEKNREKLADERKEIQRLRMVYLAKQSSQGLRRDKEELEGIRRQLERFKQTVEPGMTGYQTAAQQAWKPAGPSFQAFVIDSTDEEKVEDFYQPELPQPTTKLSGQ